MHPNIFGDSSSGRSISKQLGFFISTGGASSIVRDDDQDEENWSNQGIDAMASPVNAFNIEHLLNHFVQEQFPLVQRQWDAVSHFRTQIIHKATLSLRSYKAPPEVRARS